MPGLEGRRSGKAAGGCSTVNSATVRAGVMDQETKYSPKVILSLAIWFGLLTGLLEGVLLYLLQINQLLFWRLSNKAIWVESLWISPAIDFILFGIAGVAILLTGKLFPKLPYLRIATILLAFLLFFDLISIILLGRLSLLAIIVISLGIAIQCGYLMVKNQDKFFPLVVKTIPWLIAVSISVFIIIQGGKGLQETSALTRLPSAVPDAPNIVVIVVDALRADRLSCYGYQRDTSPYIDGLAIHGTLFENAIAPSSWTQPSHASLLTGRYTYEHQAELKPLDSRFITIGEALQGMGYRTGAISGNLFFFTRRQGFGRGFIHFEDNYQSIADLINGSTYGYLVDYYLLRKVLGIEKPIYRKSAEMVTDSALSWINRETEKPFFIFLNYFDTHDPYLPPDPYRTKFSNMAEPGGIINSYVERYAPELTPEQLQGEIDAYDGSISYVDHQLNRLFSELQKTGRLDNTLVVITSDHGESFGEHGLLQHSNSLYMEQIHVPLILIWNGHIASGNRVEVPVSISAIPATILSLIGAENIPIPGPSLTGTIDEGEISEKLPAPISELAHFPGASQQNPSTHGEMKTVVNSEFQYIVHEEFGEELYDWKTDTQEMINLAGEPAKASRIEELRQYLELLLGKQDIWGQSS